MLEILLGCLQLTVSESHFSPAFIEEQERRPVVILQSKPPNAFSAYFGVIYMEILFSEDLFGLTPSISNREANKDIASFVPEISDLSGSDIHFLSAFIEGQKSCC